MGVEEGSGVGHREVAISGSFAMNRFNFIVLPLLRNLSSSSLHISLPFFNFPVACNSAYA